MKLEKVKFDENGLIPVITQEFNTKEVLILSYMNEDALEKTINENILYYYSRCRKQLWRKGETSGNIQELVSLSYDCDGDALLAKVYQRGPACHTGARTCFHNSIIRSDLTSNVLESLFNKITDRKNNQLEESYTNYLLNEGKDKILKKIGEEASEIIIASKNNDKVELVNEICDFIYHLLVLMVNDGLDLKSIKTELQNRFK